MVFLKEFFYYLVCKIVRMFLDIISLLISPFVFIWYWYQCRRIAKLNSPFLSIIITGASRGLGAFIAYEFASPNVYLFLLGRNEQKLNEVKQICESRGACVHILLADVSSNDQMASAIHTANEIQPIDCLIANAGVNMSTLCGISENKHELLNRVIDVNSMGVLNSIFPAIRHFQQQNHGQIVLISSLASYANNGTDCAYHASKIAVRFLGEGIRCLLSECNIGVTTVNPGPIITEMSQSSLELYNSLGLNIPRICVPHTSASSAAQIIRHGVEKNYGSIDFDSITYFVCFILGGFHPIIRDVILSFAPHTHNHGNFMLLQSQSIQN